MGRANHSNPFHFADLKAGPVCAEGGPAPAKRPDALASNGTYMSLLTLIVTIVVVGVLLWAINTYIPMDGKIRTILNAVVVILLILWLLQAFGVLGSLGNVRIG